MNSGGNSSSARMRYNTSPNTKLASTSQTSPPPRAQYRYGNVIEDKCYQNQRKQAALQSPNKSSRKDYVDWNQGPPSPSKRKSLQQHDHFASPTRRVSLAVEQKEKILSLTELNNSLVKEVSGLQLDKSSLAERVNMLEDELRAIEEKICGLEQDKQELEAKVSESRGDLADREKKVQALTADKRALESERLSLVDIKGSLETQLVESDKKVKECSKRAEDAESVVAVAVDEIDNLGQKLQHQSFITEIAKKIELNGLQSCKGALRKELKKFSGMVMKSKEDVAEAKEIIHTLKSEESKFKEEKAQLETALEVAVERSSELEKQEKALTGHIQMLEGRVVELERELRAVKEERERAITEASAAEAMCESDHGLDGIRRTIQFLRENSRQGMEKVTVLQQQIADSQGRQDIDLGAAKAGLEQQMKEIMAASMEAMVKAEEQLLQLKHEVDGLNAAFVVARDASQESERDIWEAVRRLGRDQSSWIPHIPASATYILALGLFAYALYSSSSRD